MKRTKKHLQNISRFVKNFNFNLCTKGSALSDIFFQNEYMIVFPTFKETVLHKHDFYHIFFLGSDQKCEEIFVTGRGMVHSMPSLNECRLFLMIDPTSNLADYLHTRILVDGTPKRLKICSPLLLSDLRNDGPVEDKVKKWLIVVDAGDQFPNTCLNALIVAEFRDEGA